MPINITNRADLEEQVERLTRQLGLHGRGSRTAVIETALNALELEQTEGRYASRHEIWDSLSDFRKGGMRLRE